MCCRRGREGRVWELVGGLITESETGGRRVMGNW